MESRVPLQIEYRKTQAIFGNSTLGVVIPKHFADNLNISKGDYLKLKQSGAQIIIEKAETE